MNIICAICNDLIIPSGRVYMTKCGHVFHQYCLQKWTEQAQSCPQCRARVSDKEMYRMYPTLAEPVDADPTTLQNRLDDAELRLREERMQLEIEKGACRQVMESFKRTKETLQRTEKELRRCESTIADYKCQISMLRVQDNRLQDLKKENEELRQSVYMCQSVQRVVSANTAEVNEMLKSHSDIRTVALFAVALKKALLESEHKNRENRKAMVQAQRKATLLANKLSESEKLLMEMMHNQEASAAHDQEPSTAHDQEPSTAHNQEAEVAQGSETEATPELESRALPSSSSPYLMLQRGHSMMNASSIKPSEQMYFKHGSTNAENVGHVSPPETGYDGLGGHSRPDNFPRATVPTRTKKHKLKNPQPGVSKKRPK